MRSDKTFLLAVTTFATAVCLDAGCGPQPGDEPSIDSAQRSEAPSIDSAQRSEAPSINATPVGSSSAALTAADRCAARLAPDYVETVSHYGSSPGVSFPSSADPANVIYPGDVVRVTATGSVRYNSLGLSAGPGGDGVIAGSAFPFPGLPEVSSIARWNNNPGGWVGSPMLTTSLAGCTAAPAGYPVRLLYQINDWYLADNGGQWDLRTELYRLPGRVAIEGLEFTQGVQTPQGQIPLIASKRTFVRVYVRGTDDGRGPLVGVTASLTVEGESRVYAPIGSPSITAPLGGSDRRSLADSFLFELDAAAIASGSRRVTVTVNQSPGRGDGVPVTRGQTVTFGPAGAASGFKLYAARYSYYNIPPAMQAQLGLTSSWWQARPASAWEPMRQAAENALPLAQLAVSDLAPSAPWGSVYLDCRAVLGADGRWGCGGYVDGRTWATSTIDAMCPGGGCWLALLQPEIDTGHHGAHWMTPRGNHAINLQGESAPIEQGLTLAHEIGHGLTLAHTWEDPSYPRADGGLGPYVGLRDAPGFSLVSGKSAAGATTAYDLMSYASPAWFSPYSYCKALAVSSGGRLTCPAGTSL